MARCAAKIRRTAKKLTIASGGALEIASGATVTGLPQAAAVADAAGAAPTAAEYNALLAALRAAGLLATE